MVVYGLKKDGIPTVDGVALPDLSARETWGALRAVRNSAVLSHIDPDVRVGFRVDLGRFVEASDGSYRWEQVVEAGATVRLGDVDRGALAQAIADRGEWLAVSVGSDGIALVATEDPVHEWGVAAVSPAGAVVLAKFVL